MDATKRAVWALERLHAAYGIPRPDPSAPVETLVLTILSQNTNDVNRDRAYASLLERFGTLDAVRTAPVGRVSEAIRHGGLHRQKAERIVQVLDRIVAERGRLDLSFLESMPLDDAMAWLLASPGVGHKTAGIVMLFSFGRAYFPVDTHIRRVFTRVGLIGPRDDPHRRMNEILPADAALMSDLHLLTIRLGREVCHPRRPECPVCPLRTGCDEARIDAV